MLLQRLLLTLSLALPLVPLGCSSSGGNGTAPDAPPAASGPMCQEGFAFDNDLGACTEIVAATCPANTMPVIGSAECQPVGWTTACPAGFKPGASGWGCVDTFPVPTVACPGASREDVKTGKCVPIGDCTAAFPPAAATLFVDDDGIEDATHFKTFAAANTAAKSGSTIAIESGTYSEFLEVTKTNITIVGRCAEKVLFKSPGGPRAGMFASSGASGKVSGVTVSGYVGGVLAEGGDLTVEDSLIDANNTLGLYAHVNAKVTMRRSKISNTVAGADLGSAIVVYDGSVVTLEDTAVVDNYFCQATVDSKDDAGDGISTLIATRTLFARNQKYMGKEKAISVVNGGVVKLTQSAILDAVGVGVDVDGAGSRAELTESVIRRTSGTLADESGVGAIVNNKGAITLTASAVTDEPVLGVYSGTGGTMTLDKSVITGVPVTQSVEFGRGASATGGTLKMTSSAVVGCPQSGIGLQGKATGTFDHVYVKDSRTYDTHTATGQYGGFGLLTEDSSTATIKNSSFDNNALAGLTSSLSAVVTAEAVLVRGTKEVPTLSAGSGIQIADKAKMTLTRCALVGNFIESASVSLAATLSMTDSSIHGTSLSGDNRFGHGVAIFGMSRADLTNVTVFGNPGVGVVADGGGQAFIQGGTIAKNTVALHAQNGSSITQSDATSDLTAGEMRVSTTTRFVDNQTRVGSGVIALPQSPIQ